MPASGSSAVTIGRIFLGPGRDFVRMKTVRYLVALSCACTSVACGTEVATAVKPASEDGSAPEKPPQCTSTKLKDRLIRSTIPLSDSVRYKRTGYYYGLPQDDRIAFSVLNDNIGMVAWVDSLGSTVHVTPLAITPDSISLFGTDVPVQGTELSGLVALSDGFALLTRRTDPGDPLGDGMTPLQATYLVRWKDRNEIFSVPLTGTKSIVSAPDNQKRDFPSPVSGYFNSLSGRLAFNGTHFAAYFSVRGANGDLHEDTHGDKFVEVDKNGQFVNGWRMGCRTSLGNRLVAEPNGFLAFCLSNGDLGEPGVHLVIRPGETTRLAPENATWADYGNFNLAYAGGNFGSAIPTPSGYLVAWASRGVRLGTGNDPNPDSVHPSHEPAVAILDRARNIVPLRLRWPFLPDNMTQPTSDAVNVHAGVYGDNVLLVWESIDNPQFRDNLGYSTGAYGGTHLRLVDSTGEAASDDEIVTEAIAPNGQDDIVRFPNGDLGWAYVPEVRDFQTVLSSSALPNVPSISEIKFVRVRYCIP
jgi:hypothetical protein